MLKRLPATRKLQFTTTTIRVLTEQEQKLVGGGYPTSHDPPASSYIGCSKTPGCKP